MRWAPPCLPVILATWHRAIARDAAARSLTLIKYENAAALADAVCKLQNVGETFDLTAMQQKACQAYNAEQNYRELMTIYREIMRNENS